MSKNNFIHLHVHTEYSLLDGLPKIKNLITKTKELGMDSVAITDHGVMYGAIEFYKKAIAEEVKPIIGIEGYIVPGDHKEKNASNSQNYHILLLAKNNQGYQNLMKLSSLAHLEGFYYKPRFSHDLLEKYHEDLICTSACPKGEVGQALIEDDFSKASDVVKWYQQVFGEDYYLEIQRHPFDQFAQNIDNNQIKNDLLRMQEENEKLDKGTIKLSRELGIPLVATNDVHYLDKQDAPAQDALVCISTGKNVSDTKRLRYIDMPDLYFKSPEDMCKIYSDIPDACENSVKIAQKCNIEIKIGEWFFPKVQLPEGVSAVEQFEHKVNTGLHEKYETVTDEIQKRADYEMKVIIDKGYAPYFLIYEDMSLWARENQIPINTRGSVAGSIVSYSLGITTVDPIKYNLPFERFLNPFRPSAPDIDLDIADDKREEMIIYLTKKYGKEKLAQICTFGRMLARGSVRDVARVLGYPYETGDKISKMIPEGSQGFPMTINRALEDSPELLALYKEDADAQKILDFAKQIEGNARHISVHAAGVVIAPEEITNFTPIQLEPSGEKVITQYEMHACEDIGLVKLDVLGIRNLSILREAVQLVQKHEGLTVDLLKIPIDDEKTYKMLSRGDTMGTFQLSGSGMTRYLKQLKPERIEDINAMIALFRPGPMANIPDYIARKKGQQKVTYYHPKMESFLDKSFGILVYQDDLLFTALELAGYNWEEVDKFRKAVGKKIPEEMAKQHVIFVEGCMKHSAMSKKEAEGLWGLFEPFQGYGFNKAHAASYGFVAYQTAYMKANYPVEFMCALLTAESNDTDKVSLAINECRRMKIKVLQPDINESGTKFKIVENKTSLNEKAIRFGLSAIKNVGNAAIKEILKARKNGHFNSFTDFLQRVELRKVNKKVLESLIKVGALSEYGNRKTLLSSLDTVRDQVARSKSTQNQQGLFSQEEIRNSSSSIQTATLIQVEEFSEEEIQTLERQLLGLSLSAKPINEILGELGGFTTDKVEDVFQNGTKKTVKLAVVVDEVRVVVTKKSGQEMAFVKAKDETGTLNLVVFPSIYKDTRDTWVDNNPVLVTGKIDEREDEYSLLVNEIETKSSINATQNSNDYLSITIPKSTGKEQLLALSKLLAEYPGSQKVYLIFEAKDNQKVETKFKVSWNKQLAGNISEVLENNASN